MGDRIGLIYSGKVPNLLCCDSTLRRLPGGDWIAVFLSGGHAEPLPENNIFITRSQDQGQTWSPIQPVFHEKAGAYVPTELIVTDSRLYLYAFKHDGKFWDWQSCVSVSEDAGETWSDLHPIPYKTEYTCVRNLLIRKDGTWVLPYQHYIVDEEEAADLQESGRPLYRTQRTVSENGVMVSRDQGATWDGYDGAKLNLGYFNWAENNVAELSDGTLAMLIRVDRTGVIYRSDSTDGGKSWSDPSPTSIPNPGTKFRLFNCPNNRIALVHNPNAWDGLIGKQRNPLSLWISDDDLQTWTSKRDLVTFPGQLAYPDGFLDEEQGMIHFAFDYNRHDMIYYGARLDGGNV
jgi:predicted neuraminidase